MLQNKSRILLIPVPRPLLKGRNRRREKTNIYGTLKFQNALARSGLVSACLGSSWLGSAWLCPFRPGSTWLGTARPGSVRAGSARLGSASAWGGPGEARAGQGRPGEAGMLILCCKSIHPRPYGGKKQVILAEARLGIGLARTGLGSARLGSS